jgi:hypothetical protein
MILDALRNIFGASDGHVHPASVICLGRVVFGWYRDRAIKEAIQSGRHPWDVYAEEFGMTRQEWEEYVYSHDYPHEWEDMHELERWKEEHDPMTQLNKIMKAKYGY